MRSILSHWTRAAAATALLCASVSVASAQPGGWTKYENLSPVTGADGKIHSATCSGLPGTSPAFSFWAKRGTSRNLVVYFEGGGACWDNLTCTFPIGSGLPAPAPQFYVPAVLARDQPGRV